LTIFCHCSFGWFLSRTVQTRGLGKKPSTVLAEDRVSKGLAMLIRGYLGVHGISAFADAEAIPAAFLPDTVTSGLLLLICP
jgi:hypothetical protein